MQPLAAHQSRTNAAPLAVADWNVDAEAVAARCRAVLGDSAGLHILVPAWLHGIDWAGDPWGSVPCAERQLGRLTELCLASGLHVESSVVGDPDPVSAICDAVSAAPVAEILLFAHGRHLSPAYPLSVARRAARLTGLGVHGFAIATPPPSRHRRPLAGGHCRPPRAAQLV